ncbi:LysR family transcriptional regulator [Paenibacillus macerans]|uniref:LysR family transcriptional regulator n=1 Tax=Paenibacillus macerans TaxID=44252 RepID=A0A6N8EZS8_PAEMA|nr:LysR family transcriptional regulator [Paenibacillus macerans]MBS5912720.1 LysR family transcriptional regulator [Paenibacillus macerans]MEC0141001.1 LysR family transcriptional regulator [Paenibacillus macerans]MUG23878.1 LysR family transcriptional regulator [Paenibacillus macerans]UMV46529.1 LysR family transcriptional regulator [Paenibacillus macerans]GBK63265.1 LysR family transcriptional regulator [Paenibacillus macerans]
MELLQLQYFQTVARLEHMTKAAQELHIAQPALSKTIARLEQDLGVPLFDRQSRQIRLNHFGRAFLKKVDLALNVLEEGRKEVADLAGTERGSIHLATNNLGRITSAISAYRTEHPEVNFRILQTPPASMEELVNLLENGEVDLCFTAASIDHPDIREQPVLDAEVFLAVPPGHPLERRSSIRLEEVAAEPFIEYKTGHPFRKINASFCREAGISPNIVCEVDEPSALGSLVQAGLGVAFMPACRKDETPPYKMLRLETPVCRRVFRIAWLERRYLPKAARSFGRFLAEYYAELQAP